MCGRFSLRAAPDELVEHFALAETPAWTPRYNVAPTQDVGAVRGGRPGAREWALLRWGLIPSGAADPSIGARTINARSETVREKPSFKGAFAGRRCLIPADGFYEWRKTARGKKQPLHFRLRGNGLFALAGLWDRWVDPAGVEIESCTILTTTPNRVVAPVHDRMPVILPPDAYDPWLEADADPDDLLDLARPFPADRMESVEVNPVVNRTAVDGPECLEPPPPPVELDLFGDAG